MKVYISQHCDLKANKVYKKIIAFGMFITEYFKEKNYGSDLKDFMIVFVIQKVEEGMPLPSKLLKPFYVDYKEKINPYTKIPIVFDKFFQYGILLNDNDYEYSITCSEEEFQKLCAKLILESFHNFDKLPKKATDFNKESFLNDFIFLFKEKKILEIPEEKKRIYGE